MNAEPTPKESPKLHLISMVSFKSRIATKIKSEKGLHQIVNTSSPIVKTESRKSINIRGNQRLSTIKAQYDPKKLAMNLHTLALQASKEDKSQNSVSSPTKKPKFLKIFKKNKLNIMPSILKKKLIYHNGNIVEFDEKYIDEIVNVITSSKRTHEELTFLKGFFKNIPTFSDLVSKSSINFDQIFDSIVNLLKYEFLEKNKIIFRYGDQGDKFYIILSGKVQVLAPKLIEQKMSFLQFMEYLNMLKNLGEIEMRDQIIEKNKANFPNDYIITPFMNDYTVRNSMEQFVSKTSVSQSKVNAKRLTMVKNDAERHANSISPNKQQQRNSAYYKLPIRKSHLKDTSKRHKEKKKKKIQENITHYEYSNYMTMFKMTVGGYKQNNDENEKESDSSLDSYYNSSVDYLDQKEFDNSNMNYDYDQQSVSSPRKSYKSNLKVYKIFEMVCVAELKQGDKFGDLALLTDNNQRNATIIVSEDSKLLYLTKINYQRTLKDIYTKEMKSVCDLLKKTNLFTFNFDVKQAIVPFIKRVVFTKNQYVAFMGEKPSNIYIITKGEFKLTCKLSINEAECLLRQYCKVSEGVNVYKNININFIPDINDNLIVERLLNKQYQFSPLIIRQNEVLFLDNLLINEKSIFNVLADSDEVECLYMNINHFRLFVYEKEMVKQRVAEVIEYHKEIMVKLMVNCFKEKLNHLLSVKNNGNEISYRSVTKTIKPLKTLERNNCKEVECSIKSKIPLGNCVIISNQIVSQGRKWTQDDVYKHYGTSQTKTGNKNKHTLNQENVLLELSNSLENTYCFNLKYLTTAPKAAIYETIQSKHAYAPENSAGLPSSTKNWSNIYFENNEIQNATKAISSNAKVATLNSTLHNSSIEQVSERKLNKNLNTINGYSAKPKQKSKYSVNIKLTKNPESKRNKDCQLNCATSNCDETSIFPSIVEENSKNISAGPEIIFRSAQSQTRSSAFKYADAESHPSKILKFNDPLAYEKLMVHGKIKPMLSNSMNTIANCMTYENPLQKILNKKTKKICEYDQKDYDELKMLKREIKGNNEVKKLLSRYLEGEDLEKSSLSRINQILHTQSQQIKFLYYNSNQKSVYTKNQMNSQTATKFYAKSKKG